MKEREHVNAIIPHLFRTEYAKITAVTGRLFGLTHLEIAEDLASETFLKATEIWSQHGIPENPTAWLYTVAKNKAKDYLKRQAHFQKKFKSHIQHESETQHFLLDFHPQYVQDSQLRMIFAVCDSQNPPEYQVSLALQILCGFSVSEIATALLTSTETIKKRLTRARKKLKRSNFFAKELTPPEISSRLDVVLLILYLLFNEGYYSRSKNQIIRNDLCAEAMRLARLLTENEFTNTPEVNALLALMCFQTSRLDARSTGPEEIILFDEQDRSLWNKTLIEKGNFYLLCACSYQRVSKYHLEASIAYWHVSTADDSKWEKILHLYNQLVLMEYSPVTALNRAFALAKVYGNEKGIVEAEKLNLTTNAYYYCLLGFLFAPTNPAKAIEHYKQAVQISISSTEKKQLFKRIQELQ